MDLWRKPYAKGVLSELLKVRRSGVVLDVAASWQRVFFRADLGLEVLEVDVQRVRDLVLVDDRPFLDRPNAALEYRRIRERLAVDTNRRLLDYRSAFLKKTVRY